MVGVMCSGFPIVTAGAAAHAPVVVRAVPAPAPNLPPDPNASVTSVSCAEAGKCVAVGSVLGTKRGLNQAVIYTQADGHWSAQMAPEPRVPAGTRPLTLSSIQCMAVGTCIAGGTVLENPCNLGCGAVPNANVLRVVVLSDRGGTWKASSPLDLKYGLQGSGQLTVGCVSKTSCVLVGAFTETANNKDTAYLGVGSGLRWAFSPAPGVRATKVSHRFSQLGPIACRATCVIAGEWTDSSDAIHPAAISGVPGHWLTTSLPFLPAGSKWVNLELSGAACGSASDCVISGSYGASPGGTTMLLYEHRGNSWIRVHVPIPRGDHVDGANVVACPPSGGCRAFTNYSANPGGPFRMMVLSQSKTSWRHSLAKNETPYGLGDAVAASCPSSSSCVAIGESYVVVRIFGVWTAREVPAPYPGGGAYFSLSAIACPMRGTCAMGGRYADSNGFYQGLIASLHGISTTERRAPLPAGAGVRPSVALAAITCPRVGRCFAIGAESDMEQGLGPFAVVETLTSGSWKSTTIHLPGDTGWPALPDGPSWIATNPVHIACASTTSCVAMGTLNHQKTGAYTLLEMTLASGKWTAGLIKVPDVPNVFPSASTVGVESLACAAAGSCVAVGSLWNADQDHGYGIVLQQQSGGWKIHEFDDAQKCLICYPGSPGFGFSSVSCWNPTSCIAVGDTVAISSGGRWQDIGSAPDPRHDDGAVLSDVSCRPDGRCVAVGFDTGHPPAVPAFLDTYSGGKWAAFSEPAWRNPVGNDQPLSGPSAVSCPESGLCVAAGQVYGTGSQSGQQSVVWTGMRGSWASTDVPKPGGRMAPAPSVTGVTCFATDSCMATGEGYYPALLVSYGGKWTAQYAPEPGPYSSNDFVGGSSQGVSCPATNACVAIGGWTDGAGQARGFFDEQGVR